MTAVEVRLAAVDEILALRTLILRGPDYPMRVTEFDELPEARHIGAFADGVAVGCASVFPAPYEDVATAWQLRGMAVAADRQGTGLGAQVLLTAIEEVRRAGAPLLWANARVTALGFYERLGFTVVGEEFIHGPNQLPHRVVLLPLEDG